MDGARRKKPVAVKTWRALAAILLWFQVESPSGGRPPYRQIGPRIGIEPRDLALIGEAWAGLIFNRLMLGVEADGSTPIRTHSEPRTRTGRVAAIVATAADLPVTIAQSAIEADCASRCHTIATAQREEVMPRKLNPVKELNPAHEGREDETATTYRQIKKGVQGATLKT